VFGLPAAVLFLQQQQLQSRDFAAFLTLATPPQSLPDVPQLQGNVPVGRTAMAAANKQGSVFESILAIYAHLHPCVFNFTSRV
jgi:hypothetical protein